MRDDVLVHSQWREKLKERFIRGQSAVPLSQLVYEIQAFNAEEVKRRAIRNFRPVKLIGVPYPFGTEHEHSLTVGSPGSGKSQAIHELLESIRARGDRAIIYDSALEFTSHHFDPETDVILNPYDARSMAWSPYNDATDVPGLEKLATCIFKEPKGGDPYWTKTGDRVNDFKVGEDVIDLRALLAGYKGADPIADGRIKLQDTTSGAVIHYDADGAAGSGAPVALVTLSGVSASSLTMQTDWVFI